MRKRNHQIIVRLDDEELLMLKRKIHRSDLTMAEYFRLLIENIFRTITYLYNGMFSVFTLQITAISVPAAIIGLAIGGRIDRRIDEKRAKKAVIIVFIIGGISILVKALLFRT